MSSLLENPGFALLVIVAFIAGVLLFPALSALRRPRGNKGDSEPVRMREPRIVSDFGNDYRERRYDRRDTGGYPDDDSYEHYDRGYVAEDQYQRPDRGHAGYADQDRGQDGPGYAAYPEQNRGERQERRGPPGYPDQDRGERQERWGPQGYPEQDHGERQERWGPPGYADQDRIEHEEHWSSHGYADQDRGERQDRWGSPGYADQDRSEDQDERRYAGYVGTSRGVPYANPRQVEAKSRESEPREIFGSGGATKQRRKPLPVAGPAKGLWFVFGAAMGIGVMILWSSPPTAKSLATLLAVFESPNPSAVAEEPSPPAASKAQERVGSLDEAAAPTPVAVGGDTDAMIESFVTNLRGQLPMAVGPGITMASVDAGTDTIALGFTIAQSIADEDAPKLQSELETRFRNTVCATEPDSTNINGLNQRGVSFLIDYTDLLGKNVASLVVGPNFCASPA